jgi:hypothetical protein
MKMPGSALLSSLSLLIYGTKVKHKHPKILRKFKDGL